MFIGLWWLFFKFFIKCFNFFLDSVKKIITFVPPNRNSFFEGSKKKRNKKIKTMKKQIKYNEDVEIEITIPKPTAGQKFRDFESHVLNGKIALINETMSVMQFRVSVNFSKSDLQDFIDWIS